MKWITGIFGNSSKDNEEYDVIGSVLVFRPGRLRQELEFSPGIAGMLTVLDVEDFIAKHKNRKGDILAESFKDVLYAQGVLLPKVRELEQQQQDVPGMKETSQHLEN